MARTCGRVLRRARYELAHRDLPRADGRRTPTTTGRTSSHDSRTAGDIVVDEPPTADAGGPYAVVEHGSVVVAATADRP
jgi:hypothetical protein